MTIGQLTNEALSLPLNDRATLAQQLWDSIHDQGTIDRLVDDKVRAEIERRDAEMETGEVQGIPHDQAMAIIEKSLRCT